MSELKTVLCGTGFASRLRAKALQGDSRVRLTAVQGSDPKRCETFAAEFGLCGYTDIDRLLAQERPDLVVISTRNDWHEAIARQALEAGCHVVVEYPLTLDPESASALIALAQARQQLLHVAHIELLSGVHQALLAHLSSIGSVASVRYTTLSPKQLVGDRWNYRRSAFGYPLVGALSRLERLLDAFGPVAWVSSHVRYIPTDSDVFRQCLCVANLGFASGAIATVTYGKGEALWKAERCLEVRGSRGMLLFNDLSNLLITAAGEQSLDVGGRQGLFLQDSEAVLKYLLESKPLYISAQASLYALRVADACWQAAQTGQRTLLEFQPEPTR
jgi:biliverdin reductase